MTCPPSPHREAMIPLVDPPTTKVHPNVHRLPTKHHTAPRICTMTLKSLRKIIRCRVPLLAPLLLALTLTGCITATGPILGDAKAILGERIQVHAFTTTKHGTREHSTGIL